MKELTVLAEDWMGEIDISLADVQIENGGVTIRPNIVISMGSTYYMMTPMGAKLEEIKPKPRHENSIKLSECDGRHLIFFRSLTPIRMAREEGEWVGRSMTDLAKVKCRYMDLVSALRCANMDKVRVFDMASE